MRRAGYEACVGYAHNRTLYRLPPRPPGRVGGRAIRHQDRGNSIAMTPSECGESSWIRPAGHRHHVRTPGVQGRHHAPPEGSRDHIRLRRK
jgi:hypothetical protein